MAIYPIQRSVNLDETLRKDTLYGELYGGEQDSHEFIISATRGGADYAFDGTATARYIRADGQTLMLSGTVAGGKCIVELPQACYAVPGRFTLTIFNTTDAGVKGAVYSCTGNVAQTTTGEELDPGSAVPDIDDIQAEYRRMRAATDAATVAAAAGNGALRAVGPYNAYDVLAALPKTNETAFGITYTWSEDGSCAVSGTCTSSSGSQNLIYLDYAALPYNLVPGGKYRVRWTSTNINIRLNIIQYDSTRAKLSDIYYSQDGVCTIHENAVGARIRLYVNSGATINETVTPKLVDGTSHQEMLDGSNLLAAYTPTGDTFSLWDDMPNACYWSGYPSKFTASIDDASLTFDENTTYQIIKLLTRVYICSPSTKQLYVGQRAYSGVQYWYDLSSLATGTFASRSVLPDAENLNNITTPGYYTINSSYTYENLPLDTNHGGILIVFPATRNTIGQIVINNINGIFWRVASLGVFSSEWSTANVTNNIYNNTYTTEHYENSYNITCTPNITTDMNNYIAAPGDETDMAGAIQTMLSQTGVCRLGPGRFIISTGIEVPDYGALIGSGPSTALILSESVTTGYAVKLNNYACVRDIRLAKQNSDGYTPAAEVGACHGILFEATGDASENPTYKYRSTIDNCWISGFNGGGITCNNTGISVYQHILVANCHIWWCDAGVYVPYRSEFHRFTNVSATGCYYGCLNNGGNNTFENCGFSGNTVGLLIDNSAGQSYNNSHSTYSACSFNHSGGNTGTAIRLLGLTAGEIFTGAQVFFGAIDIQNCVGVRFVGANIGRQVPISVTGSTIVTFSDSTMYSLAENPYTGSGNTTVKFTDCYIRDGSAYNPVS